MKIRSLSATGVLLCVAAVSGAQATPAVTQDGATMTPSSGKAGAASVSFELSNPALTPALWRVDFGADGAGHYHSLPGTSSAPDAEGIVGEAFEQQIEISAPVREQIFAVARTHRLFAVECESRHKVAFNGLKTVRYSGPEGQGSCTFNWSQDAQLMKVAETCMAISTTLEEGRRLRVEYLHDRLALDSELETLVAAVKSGNAIELQNIAAELRAIAGDEAVMKRAQARAAALLATLPAESERASIQSR